MEYLSFIAQKQTENIWGKGGGECGTREYEENDDDEVGYWYKLLVPMLEEENIECK